MSWFSGARVRLHLLFARRAVESRMNDEVEFHIEMETNRLVREDHLSPDEARRRALVAFGGVTQHKEALRDGRGLAWLSGMSLDFKLGLRMLLKYPGLTLVGGLAMAFAIAVGAVTFELATMFVHPTLSLPNGDRIVQIRSWDVAANRPEPHALHEFIVWRGALSSVTDLGAYRDVTLNLIASDGDARGVQVAEITASGFRIAPTPPLLGRVLVATDEAAAAPPVVVLGHEVWRTRFASDPGVIGRAVQLGDTYATVVGVMPEGFAFPVSHDLWMPLRPDAFDQAPRKGPGITIFGRLAPSVTLEAAQTELTMLGRRVAAELPDTHKQLEPRVAPYAKMYWEPTASDLRAMFSIYVFALMLLGLICGNVALLLFARAATRETELLVRSALGASRGRIIAQLFAEALVLGAVAAIVGLVAADLGLRTWALSFLELNLGRLPFWYDPRLSPATVLYAVGLTLVAAAIAGVLPALKVTRGLGSRMKEDTAGGGGLRFGGVWTAVIITQVAFTVAFPAVAYVEQGELRRIQSLDVGFAAEEYLAVRLDRDAPDVSGADSLASRAAQGVRFGAALQELRLRVAAEPGVSGVTFVDRLPRDYHPERRIELDDPSASSGQRASAGSGQTPAAVPRQPNGAASLATQDPLPEVSLASIDPSYFDVLEAPILAGRGFHDVDRRTDARVVIVDQGFVDVVLHGRNAVGQRIRFAETRKPKGNSAEESRPWYEIVGVVKDLGMGYAMTRQRAAGVYQPANLESPGRLQMVVHVKGDPMALSSRVRTIATAVDPTLRLSDFKRADKVTDALLWILGVWLRITVVLTAIALLLSLAGIYAVLSFTVARRTREIGVRVALGASQRGVVTAIFRRPLTQVAIGVAAGGIAIAVVALVMAGSVPDEPVHLGRLSIRQVALLVTHAALMLGVCLLACVVPTRRALSVEPTEALRAE